MDLHAQLTWRRGLAALVILAALGVAGGYGVAAGTKPRPITVGLEKGARAKQGASAAPARTLTVHVAGRVVSPGIYKLPDGSRVDDAVKAAGGPAGDADLDSLNLAARLKDGDKVVVPARSSPGAGSAGARGGGGATAGSPGGRVNINSATAAELDTLPGIGPALAQRIVAFREAHGGFRSEQDLLKVPGIGPGKFEALKDLVTV